LDTDVDVALCLKGRVNLEVAIHIETLSGERQFLALLDGDDFYGDAFGRAGYCALRSFRTPFS
jgi:hypothetical protein